HGLADGVRHGRRLSVVSAERPDRSRIPWGRPGRSARQYQYDRDWRLQEPHRAAARIGPRGGNRYPRAAHPDRVQAVAARLSGTRGFPDQPWGASRQSDYRQGRARAGRGEWGRGIGPRGAVSWSGDERRPRRLEAALPVPALPARAAHQTRAATAP